MSDEGQLIRGILWRQTFPFINIFRSFRIAIHLSKLALGLALLILVYVGGRTIDGFWFSSARALPGEIPTYRAIVKGESSTTLSAWRDETRKEIDAGYAEMLIDYDALPPIKDEGFDHKHQRAVDDSSSKSYLSDLEKKIVEKRETDVKQANDAYNTALKAADDAYTANSSTAGAAKTRDDMKDAAAKARDAGIEESYAEADKALSDAHASRGSGLFDAFFQYEIRQMYLVVESVVQNDWLGPDGVVEHVDGFFAIGPVWLVTAHTIFAVIFGIWFLLAWAVFGGAVSRIAAVQVARDEKISIRQALNFSVGKVLSFGSAPVIPVLIVIVIGLVVAIGALVGNIPFLGPIVIGGMFFLAMIAGFVMTLVLLGTAGGFNLMYPTIAVEGSDSFDAISRSFSYVYARPWRMLFYTIVALIYGAATYLFVHLFIWMMLVLAHHFVGMGLFTKAANTHDLLSVMWPGPSTAGRLAYHVNYDALTFGQSIGAFLIRIWVMLLVSFLGAFAISLYFSANTIIYYLMRQEVDATEMEEVYLEQSDDDFDAVPASPAGSVTTATVTVTSVETSTAPPSSAAPPGDSPA